MSRTGATLKSTKGSNILQRINKKIQGTKSSKVLKCDSDGLYKPLNVERHEIRLLHLKPSLELQEQPQYFLETVSLDDNPQFEALSYAWGDPSLTRPIRLENREWYATVSLEAGLRYLRSPSEDMVIWVDALCIDESSIEERNSQVLLMRTIYSNATRVKVWLGKSTRGSDDALAILDHMGRKIPFTDIRFHGKELNEKHAMYMDELMNRPWWTRVWVQQEHILAKDITLHCGLGSTEFSPILKTGGDLVDFLERKESRLTRCLQPIFDSALSYGNHNGNSGYDLTFAEILARGCFKDCTDVRDSIYGFLGLAREDVVDAIKPDYSIPLKEVLQRTAVQHMNCTRSLLFFNFTTLRCKDKCLVPTWVPDWPRLGPVDITDPGSTQNLERDQWRHRILRFVVILDFDACANRSLSFDPINETTVMLNGNCSGEVTDVSPDASHRDLNGLLSKGVLIKVIESWLEFFEQFADHTAFPSSNEGRESPFWRIVIGDRYHGDRGIWRSSGKTDYEAYQAMKRELVTEHWATSEALDYCTSFICASEGRRLFATDRGYIGLGPPEMQKGDHVYILSGGEVPYLLRPVSGPRPRTFELVGDCYLHGIMYGEEAGTDEDYHDVYLE